MTWIIHTKALVSVDLDPQAPPQFLVGKSRTKTYKSMRTAIEFTGETLYLMYIKGAFHTAMDGFQNESTFRHGIATKGLPLSLLRL